MSFPKFFFDLDSNRRVEYILRKELIDNNFNIGFFSFINSMFIVLGFLLLFSLELISFDKTAGINFYISVIPTFLYLFKIMIIILVALKVFVTIKYFIDLSKLNKEFSKSSDKDLKIIPRRLT